MKTAILLILLALGSVWLFTGGSPRTTSETWGVICRKHWGDLKNADGTTFRPSAKPYTFVYFSAGWCGPCHQYTPLLVKFYQEAGEQRDFAVVFVSSDRSPEDMADYMKEMDMPWASAVHGSAGANALKAAYGERGIPHVVLLDAGGAVIARSFEGGQYRGPNHPVEVYKSRH